MGWRASRSIGVNILVGDIIIRDELRRRFQGTPKSHTETQTKHKQWQHLQWSKEIMMIIECNSFCKTKTQCASTHHLCPYIFIYTRWHAHNQLSQEWFAYVREKARLKRKLLSWTLNSDATGRSCTPAGREFQTDGETKLTSAHQKISNYVWNFQKLLVWGSEGVGCWMDMCKAKLKGEYCWSDSIHLVLRMESYSQCSSFNSDVIQSPICFFRTNRHDITALADWA